MSHQNRRVISSGKHDGRYRSRKWEDLHKNRKSRLNSFTVDREEKEKYINDQKERYRSLRGAMVRRPGAPDFFESKRYRSRNRTNSLKDEGKQV